MKEKAEKFICIFMGQMREQKKELIEKDGRVAFEMLEKAIENTMVICVEVVTITGKFHRTGKGE